MEFKQGDRILFNCRQVGIGTELGVFLSYLKDTSNLSFSKDFMITDEPTELCLIYVNGNISVSKVYTNQIEKQKEESER